MNKEPIRIGMIMGKWVGGGVEAVIMNYYRHIDRNKIQFDFICDEDSTCIPREEIESLGGKVIICPPYQKLNKYIKFLKRLFKENNYKIVHSNINTLSVFPLYAAKKAGVPIRIAHSHSTSNKVEWKKNIVKSILKPFSTKYANCFFACTEHAARYQFGNKMYDSGEVTIINNAIDLDKFKYNEKIRKEIRKELQIKDNVVVIGHIGRFIPQKNHTFLIDVFNEYHKKEPNSVLLLIGQGPLVNDIKNKVESLKLNDSVKFLGQKNNINDMYQAMDAFILPSIYEGLGMVLIEAQANGLPCYASTEVPMVAKVTDKINFIGLKEPIKIWVLNIRKTLNYKKREIDINMIKKVGFDIESESKKLELKYFELIGEKNYEYSKRFKK